MKTCSKCHIEKDESDFYNAKHLKSGKTPQCKVCMNEQNARYQRENRRGKWKDKTRVYIADELINELEIVFLKATGCNFKTPDDAEMAIRILLAK